MKTIKNIYPIVLLAVGFLVGAYFFISNAVFGNVTSTIPVPTEKLETYTFFATSTAQTFFATTTSAVSTAITPWTDSNGRIDNGYFVIAGAKDVTFYFGRGDTHAGGGNTGTSVFTVEVSPNGTDWTAYPQLAKATTTPTTADTYFARSANSTITAATTTDIYKLSDTGWYAVRCRVVETTDGEHSCKATATY